jgi:general L-amino acid transport system permease protein
VAFSVFARYLGIGLLLAILVFVLLKVYERRSGRLAHAMLWALLVFGAVAVAGWWLSPTHPLALDTPRAEGLRLAGGKQLSPEFMALLVGLSIYTSAFIADVVRAGIQSVSRGQIEAPAPGLKTLQSLQLIVLPQALRVIPLTSQYLNLIKNSSLAVVIGFRATSPRILNQVGGLWR